MSGNQIYAALLIMALTIYSIRLVPFLFLRKPIKSRLFRSFLYYVPYVTLAVMTFPAILTVTGDIRTGAASLAVGLLVAWLSGDLFAVAVSCCVTVFLVALIL